MRKPSSLRGLGLSRLNGRSGRKILSQIVIGTGVALVGLYVLRMLGVEIGRVYLLIACVIGILLVFAGLRLRAFRRVAR